MQRYVQPQRSRATQAPLEPVALNLKVLRQEQAFRLSLWMLASFLLLSSPLSCEVRGLHAQPNRVDGTTAAKLTRYQAMLQLIDSYYVDERRVSGLIDSLMATVMLQLDPHSFYMDREATIESNAHFFNKRAGTYGLAAYRVGKDIVVRTVANGGPAERAGILPGDKIERIWGQPIQDLKEEEITAFFTTDNHIDLSISRKANSKRFTTRIIKNHMPERSVAFYHMLDAATGYIYLTAFITSTFNELQTALKDLESQGMKKLVLDLRDNSGGLLDQSHECASLFLDRGAKLTALMHRGDTGLVYATAKQDGPYRQLEMVVLVDEETASAGEILAGILQDHDRALLIGQPTYGKGLVQKQFDLPDGGAFRLTSSRYHLPSGRCIQRQYEGASYIGERKTIADGLNLDHHKDTLLEPTHKHGTAAGRSVYAGQGVVPEVVVSLDTISTLIDELRNASAFNLFLDEYLNYNAGAILAKHKTVDHFLAHYSVSKATLPILVRKAKNGGVVDAGARIEKEQSTVLAYTKRWMCYRLYPETGWMLSRRQTDTQFQEAVKHLQQQLVFK